MKYLIIGNSAAGVGAIEAIRKLDNNSNITVISDEPYLAYSRPLIAEYLSDSVEPDRMWYRNEEFYSNNNIELVLSSKVFSINPNNKIVKTSNNSEFNYDKLLIATGGKPYIPQIEGINTEGIYTFVRWDEVKKLKNKLENIKKAVVIGGGLIGLKAAEHLLKCNINVTIVELAPALLSLVLDQTASGLLQNHFETNGAQVITENTVQKINSYDGKIYSVTLKDNQTIDCDALIIAIGVVPNKDLIEGSNIQTNRGILVNEYLQTNYEDIYAAGDVSESYDILLEQTRVLPIWPLAFRQGYLAGCNMAGNKRNYKGGISMNSLEFFHLPIISAGITTTPDQTYTEDYVLNEKKKVYKKVVIKENNLKGFIYVNKIDRAGILTGLILDKDDISSFKEEILKESFGMVNLPKELREKKAASVVGSSN